MSAWGRIALVVTGAAAGAVAARWAGSERVQRAVGELTGRSREASSQDAVLESTAGFDTPVAGSVGTSKKLGRENRVASRALRIAQDIKVAMDQRESQLREQWGMATPDQVRSRHSQLTNGDGASAGAVDAVPHHDVVTPD